MLVPPTAPAAAGRRAGGRQGAEAALALAESLRGSAQPRECWCTLAVRGGVSLPGKGLDKDALKKDCLAGRLLSNGQCCSGRFRVADERADALLADSFTLEKYVSTST